MKRPAKLVVSAAVVLVVPLLMGPGNRKRVTECAIFEPVTPGGMADVSSTTFTSNACLDFGTGAVEVGTNVWTYSLEWIELWLSEELVQGTGISRGPHWGVARVLKKNATEGGRFDFKFGWNEGGTTYRYRLIVTEGIYDNEADVVVYEPPTSEMYLVDYGSSQPPKEEGTPSFSISFLSGGDTGGTESGGQCKNGKDDDGDGLVDCDDPDCMGGKFCP